MKEYTNLENLVLYNDTHILISEKLPRKDREEFLSKHNINFKHYRDGCFGYRNEIIGSCSQFNKCKITEDNRLLSDVLTELMAEFTKLFNKVYPDIACHIFYDSMFNYIKESSNYYHGGYHTPEKFKKYFEGHYDGFGSYRFAMTIDEKHISVIKKAIKKIKSLVPTKIEPEIGKTYILTEDCNIGTRFKLEEGTEFQLTKVGNSWDNHSVIKILNGRIATTVHSSFFNAPNEVNGNKNKFYSLEEFKIVFGISLEKVKVSYDPYGTARYLPCIERKF